MDIFSAFFCTHNIIYRINQQPLLIREVIDKDFKYSCEFQPSANSAAPQESIRTILDEITICKLLQKTQNNVVGLLKRKLALESNSDCLVNEISRDGLVFD